MPSQVCSPARLFEFTVRIFRHFEVPEEDARTAATVLQAADLRGTDSHGVARAVGTNCRDTCSSAASGLE